MMDEPVRTLTPAAVSSPQAAARNKLHAWADRLFAPLLGVLLLLPHLFGSPLSSRLLHLGLPRVLTGDEPHYLVMINSLLDDGDLDLRNNYEKVHAGSIQAGAWWAVYRKLDHHTVWYVAGHRVRWHALYDWQHPAACWQTDPAGRVYPLPQADVSPAAIPHSEFPAHPPGLALLLAPFLFVFRESNYLEPAATLCSGVAVIVGMLFFRRLIQTLTPERWVVNAATLVAFLGTPAWFYGRTLYAEPYLLAFAIAAYSLALREKVHWLPGCLIALGTLLKPPFVLLILPLLANRLLQRRLKESAAMVLPVLVSLGITVGLNAAMYGGWSRFPIAFESGDLGKGAAGLLLSPRHGLIPFAPAAILALACWPRFIRENCCDALVLGCAAILYFVLMALWCAWSGGFCYGPRLIVPVLPFLFIALVKLTTLRVYRHRISKAACAGLCALSVLVNLIGSMAYWEWVGTHPLMELFTGNY